MTMPYSFQRLPFAVTLPDAPVILQTESELLVPRAPIAGVTNYWLFGADNPDLLDITGANPLRRNLIPTVTSAGSGYASAPTVTLSGGSGGSGATASAVVNGSGAVVGVVITDPGTGTWTAAPTASFSGGGGTGAACTIALGAAPLVRPASILLPSGDMNGLLTPHLDSLEYTQIGVFKLRRTLASPNTVVQLGCLSTMTQTGVGAGKPGGDGTYGVTGASPTQVIRTFRATDTLTTSLTLPGASDSAYIMQAISYSASAGHVRKNHFGNAGSLLTTTTDMSASPKALSNPNRRRAIGNAYFASASTYLGGEFAALIEMEGVAATDTQMADIYARLTIDLAARGVTLY